jgi:hypothetical protein
MAAKNEQDSAAEIVEQGDIYFFYRPKVENEEATSLDDVQRFHIVMRPHGKASFRLTTVGRKRLPDIGEHERTWGFVDFVAKSLARSSGRCANKLTRRRRAAHAPGPRRGQPARASTP